MTTKLTREQGLELLKKYNKEPFHILHGLTVEGTMRWFANELGYGEDADFWAMAGLLHDIDFEQYPEEHCLRAPELPKLLTMTLEAMATCEDEIQAEMRSEE